MTPVLIALTLWKCTAVDPASGRTFTVQASNKLRAQKTAVMRCEMADILAPPTTCFVKACVEVQAEIEFNER